MKAQPVRLQQTAEKLEFGVMAFHGGMSERKRWSEKGTTVKMSSCGAEQVLETQEKHVPGWVAPLAAGVVGGPQAGAGGNTALLTVVMGNQGWRWSWVSQGQSRMSRCPWGRSTLRPSRYL